MAEFIRYLFNSEGDWIATQVETNVFSVDKKWLGWVREEDKVVITPQHKYLGTVMCSNRLFYCEDHASINRPTSTLKVPPYPDHPGYPGKEDPQEPPPGARDVAELNGPGIKQLFTGK